MTAVVTLHAASLLSKWGFEDGDLLDDLLFEHFGEVPLPSGFEEPGWESFELSFE